MGSARRIGTPASEVSAGSISPSTTSRAFGPCAPGVSPWATTRTSSCARLTATPSLGSANRGNNAGLPAQWLSYVTVADLAQSMAAAQAKGGAVVHGPRDMGSYGTLCVVRDPAGAHLALMQPPANG